MSSIYTATEKILIKEGTILTASWGYEQTNIDFFRVIKRTEKQAVIQKLHTNHEPTSMGHGIATPGEDDERAAPVRFKVNTGLYNRYECIYDKRYGGMILVPWDGTPEEYTSYY